MRLATYCYCNARMAELADARDLGSRTKVCGFDSHFEHHYGPVVQLVRTPPCHGGGFCVFKSRQGRH